MITEVLWRVNLQVMKLEVVSVRLKLLMALMVALSMTGLSTASRAVTVTAQHLGKGYGRTVGIQYTGANPFSGNIFAGELNTALIGALPVGMAASFAAYCVDLDHTLQNSQTVELLSTNLLTRGKRIAWLYNQIGPTVELGATEAVRKDRGAALQLAIWDVWADDGDGFTTGKFRTSASLSLRNLAQSYLNASLGMKDEATWLRNIAHPSNRNQNLIGPAAVPEPGALAMLVGAGVTGCLFVLRRRRR
jgi:hypothetical protein